MFCLPSVTFDSFFLLRSFLPFSLMPSKVGSAGWSICLPYIVKGVNELAGSFLSLKNNRNDLVIVFSLSTFVLEFFCPLVP